MTNTYKDDAQIEVKTYDEGTFVDYQMEKFGKSFKGDTHKSKEEEPVN